MVGGPAGALELRSEPADQATTVATVKEGEVFEFEGIEDSDWSRVTLSTGKSGFLPTDRIRLFFTLDEIPEKDEPHSEVGDFGGVVMGVPCAEKGNLHRFGEDLRESNRTT